jgi:hypothetical protein
MGQTPGEEKHDEPSLELPSLSLPGFGRRKKSREMDLRKSEPETDQPSTPEVQAEQLRTPAVQAEAEQPSTPGAETAALEPVAPVEDRTLPVEDRTPPDVPVGEPAPRDASTTEVDPTPTAVTPARRRATKERKQPKERPERPERRRRTASATPKVPGRVAAAVTGLVVGAAGGVATYGAMEGCEAVRGVSTCGGAPGFFILVAILALMVLLGSVLLKAFRVSDTGSTSFLAVGVVAVVAMLVLLDVIFTPAMFVVIPVLSALAFLLAHWVTTRFDEEATDLRR